MTIFHDYMGLGMDLLVSSFDVESVVFPMGGLHFLVFCGVGFMTIWAWGWTCWCQLSMSKVWYSLSGVNTFWFSMGVYMGLGMDLLVSSFDVESVVFLKRG